MNKKQYDKIAGQYDGMLTPLRRYVHIPMFYEMIRRTGKVEGKAVIDLACGDGFFTRLLAKLNPNELMGLDISEKMIEKAVEKTREENLAIDYITSDIVSFSIPKKFDLITAFFLINYSQTKEQLNEMCSKISSLLTENGRAFGLTMHPNLRDWDSFRYETKFGHANPTEGKDNFQDGELIQIGCKMPLKEPFQFQCYYWSKESYEIAFEKAGLAISWIEPLISNEGIQECGEDYWNYFKENPSNIGFLCSKI